MTTLQILHVHRVTVQAVGGALGNAVWLTDTAVKIPAGMFLAGAAGFLVGIFIGCLIGAIAEVPEICWVRSNMDI